ncbi:uncharacterized protein LOC141910946 [Tubulanus polymorphus]|uniref:uncharacterized protein LOC141910946 n=1 Tax=Tubulanus polymorphus TaxID=672921 RepID=UPI003DA4567F
MSPTEKRIASESSTNTNKKSSRTSEMQPSTRSQTSTTSMRPRPRDTPPQFVLDNESLALTFATALTSPVCTSIYRTSKPLTEAEKELIRQQRVRFEKKAKRKRKQRRKSEKSDVSKSNAGDDNLRKLK